MALKHDYLRQLVNYRLDCVGSARLAGTRGYLMATNTQVLVVGAGPAGLFMAAELNRHGVSCRIIDKNDGPTTTAVPLAFRPARWKSSSPLALRTSLCRRLTSAMPQPPILPTTNSSNT